MNRKMLWHGFFLMLLALVSALFIPVTKIPRLALSAHTIGIMSGILLIAVGAIWQHFSLSPRQSRVLYFSWLYSSYVNWLGCLVGSILGSGKTTPVASSGVTGSPFAEIIVAVLLGSVALVSFIAVGLSLLGLRAKEVSDA